MNQGESKAYVYNLGSNKSLLRSVGIRGPIETLRVRASCESVCQINKLVIRSRRSLPIVLHDRANVSITLCYQPDRADHGPLSCRIDGDWTTSWFGHRRDLVKSRQVV